MYPVQIKGKPLHNPHKCFQCALDKAGISDFRIHDVRHTFASLCVNHGAILFEVQKLLGHEQVKTTTRQAHLADDTLRRVSDTVSKSIAKAMA